MEGGSVIEVNGWVMHLNAVVSCPERAAGTVAMGPNRLLVRFGPRTHGGGEVRVVIVLQPAGVGLSTVKARIPADARPLYPARLLSTRCTDLAAFIAANVRVDVTAAAEVPVEVGVVKGAVRARPCGLADPAAEDEP